ncbi:MAG: FtsW/RodA/SpoVE family cell cycle protein [Lachnospiraceae bacterium]|nr:FtsW/RodA/SpoVE family cell cycle protein [Lachnospiraceae bacterium]
MINRIKQYDWKKYNFSLLCVVIVICLIGAFCVKLAGGEEKGMALMKGQITGLILGLVLLIILSVIDYHFICQFTPLYYVAGILLTAATHSPLGTDNGTDVNRWVKLGPITFQPTEIMKIILILTLATLYTKLRSKTDRVSTLLIAGIVAAVPVAVILIQPDLSSSLVAVFITVVFIFAAGTAYKILMPIIMLGIPASLVLFWYVQQPGNFILRGYQFRRIYAWRNPDDPANDDINWQQNMCIRAIASGKLYGKFIQDGGAEGTTRVYSPLPVNESDFIWSVVGEEFGFLGCCLVLLLFAIVIFKCFSVARKAKDFLGSMIALGVAAMFMFQVFANICVATRVFPNTGLPLPFISNGLSSMVSSLIGIGFVMNIGIQPAKTSNAGFTMRSGFEDSNTKDIDIDLEL